MVIFEYGAMKNLTGATFTRKCGIKFETVVLSIKLITLLRFKAVLH